MTAIDFPNNPTLNQIFTFEDRTWKWTGFSWDAVIVTSITGPQGPQGPAGSPGIGIPDGGSTGQVLIKQSSEDYNTAWGIIPPSSYTHTQNAVSLEWIINHNLGYYPNIVVEDSAGTRVEADITYNNVNQIKVKLSVPLSGRAYLS